MLRRFLLLASAAFAAAFLIAPSSALPGDDDCVEGPTQGVWDLPHVTNGHLVRGRWAGQMALPNGQTPLMMRGRLHPAPTAANLGHGHMHGRLFANTGAGAMPIAFVQGHYHANGQGNGLYHCFYVVPTNTPFNHLHVIGASHGHFSDPPTPNNQPNTAGDYQGHWRICN